MSQELADKIAKDFEDFLTEFHKHDQPYDDLMDAELYEQYARVLREQSKWGYFNWNESPDGTPRPVFSPSAAGKGDRELYEKARRSKKDKRNPTPNQRDWTGLGSQVGGYIQREIMLAERHFERLTGKPLRFRFERTDRGEPAFEHFKKVMHECEFNGEKFALSGLPDGILEYTNDDGQIIRVGLEVKSFQKGWSAFKALNHPKHNHELQTICYSEMYGLDYYIILYHLTYGADWNKDINRNKAFGKFITQDDRDKVLFKFANIAKAVRTGTPPAVDLSEWRYNEYKTAIAKGISEEEYTLLKAQVKRMLRSNLPDWKKQLYYDAIEEIRDIRGA